MIRAVRLTAAALAALLLLPACGHSSGRSAKTFCATLKTQSAALQAKYKGSGNGPLGVDTSSVQAKADMAAMLDELVKVAPHEIEADVKAMDEAFHAQSAAALPGAVDSVKVTAYVRDHCIS